MSLLSIGGIALDRRTHLGDLSVSIERQPSGLHRVSISATGWYAPDLSSIDWSAPVVVVVPELDATGTTGATGVYTRSVPVSTPVRTLRIRSDGPKVRTLMGPAPNVAWSLEGAEIETEDDGEGNQVPVSRVTIGGTTLPALSHDLALTAALTWPASGLRSIRLSGRGTVSPGVGALPRSAAVTVVWVGAAGGGSLTGLIQRAEESGDAESGEIAWSVEVSEAAVDGQVGGEPVSRVTVDGTALPALSHHLGITTEVGYSAAGVRTLSLRGRGTVSPGMSGVDWSAPVAVSWTGLAAGSMYIRSSGPSISTDHGSGEVSWTLAGSEILGADDGQGGTTPASLVSIGGVDVAASASDGGLTVATSAKPGGRYALTISGRGRAAPALGSVDFTAPIAVSWSIQGAVTGSLTVLCPGLNTSTDALTGEVAWSISGEEVEVDGQGAAQSALSVGGVTLPATTYQSGLTITQGYEASGARTLSLSASGVALPAISGLDYSAPITVSWGGVLGGGSLVISTPGPSIQQSPRDGTVSWSLSGSETTLGTTPGTVTVGGVAYSGSVSVAPIGGTIRRMSDGTGTLLRAWGKRAVQITGESAAPPSVSGLISVTTSLYTGQILVRGVSATWDSSRAITSWTIDGEEP